MEIAGRKYKVKDTFDSIVTIPDCFVLGKNKLGHGHGEAKLYFGSKDTMRSFYGEEGFKVKCFLFKRSHYLLKSFERRIQKSLSGLRRQARVS